MPDNEVVAKLFLLSFRDNFIIFIAYFLLFTYYFFNHTEK